MRNLSLHVLIVWRVSPLVFTHSNTQEDVEIPAPLVFTPSPVPTVKSSCSNCEAEMTPDHQCEVTDSEAFPPESVIPASLPNFTPPGSPKRTTGRRIFPKKFVKETKMDGHPRVKCCVCACLGRETSMVLLGSKCPSCGITATDNWSRYCPSELFARLPLGYLFPTGFKLMVHFFFLICISVWHAMRNKSYYYIIVWFLC